MSHTHHNRKAFPVTQTLSAPTTDFAIKRHDVNTPTGTVRTYFTIQVVTTAGTSDVKRDGEIIQYSTRSSARKAITRLRRSTYLN